MPGLLDLPDLTVQKPDGGVLHFPVPENILTAARDARDAGRTTCGYTAVKVDLSKIPDTTVTQYPSWIDRNNPFNDGHAAAEGRRYGRIETAIRNGNLDMPELSALGSSDDGNHRLVALKKAGVKEAWVLVHTESAAEVENKFGAAKTGNEPISYEAKITQPQHPFVEKVATGRHYSITVGDKGQRYLATDPLKFTPEEVEKMAAAVNADGKYHAEIRTTGGRKYMQIELDKSFKASDVTKVTDSIAASVKKAMPPEELAAGEKTAKDAETASRTESQAARQQAQEAAAAVKAAENPLVTKAGNAGNYLPVKEGNQRSFLTTAFTKDELPKVVAAVNASGKYHAEIVSKAMGQQIMKISVGKTDSVLDVADEVGRAVQKSLSPAGAAATLAQDATAGASTLAKDAESLAAKSTRGKGLLGAAAGAIIGFFSASSKGAEPPSVADRAANAGKGAADALVGYSDAKTALDGSQSAVDRTLAAGRSATAVGATGSAAMGAAPVALGLATTNLALGAAQDVAYWTGAAKNPGLFTETSRALDKAVPAAMNELKAQREILVDAAKSGKLPDGYEKVAAFGNEEQAQYAQNLLRHDLAFAVQTKLITQEEYNATIRKAESRFDEAKARHFAPLTPQQLAEQQARDALSGGERYSYQGGGESPTSQATAIAAATAKGQGAVAAK